MEGRPQWDGRFKRAGGFDQNLGGSGGTMNYRVTCGIPEHYLGVKMDTKNIDNVRCAEFSWKSEDGSGSGGDIGVPGPFGGGSSGGGFPGGRG